MQSMDTNEIITFLKDNPGATAQEIGVKAVDMQRLCEKGVVAKLGNRKTGTRGRPPVEWALPGQEIAVQHAERDEDEIVVKAPPLPPISNDVRRILDPEHKRTIEYIEKVFRGDFGVERYPDGGYWPEPGDFKILRERYDDIVRVTSRRLKPVEIVFDDDEDEGDES